MGPMNDRPATWASQETVKCGKFWSSNFEVQYVENLISFKTKTFCQKALILICGLI